MRESDRDAWDRAVHLGGTLTAQELLGLPGGVIIRRLYPEEDVRVFDPVPVVFRCSCSRERVAAMLRMLGHEEVRAALDEQGKIDVQCEFCNQHYGFDEIDVAQLFVAGAVAPGGSSRH